MRATTSQQLVQVPAGKRFLEGDLTIPESATSLIIFAHGSGSSRFSERNNFVARILNQAGLATLLLDLLTGEEEAEDASGGHLRFDLLMLSQRLVAANDWADHYDATAAMKRGLFGASTGGGAALIAAAQRPDGIQAVVSRGGRPDLAGQALSQVQAPTLLIVGGSDTQVIQVNRIAISKMSAEITEIDVVPGAGHLFEEPGAMEKVAQLTRDWFIENIAQR